MVIKNIVKDERADAMVIMIFLFSMAIMAVTWMILEDFVNYFIPIYSTMNTLLGNPTRTEVDETFNLLIFLLKYVLIPAFFTWVYWTYSKSQKPQESF